VFLGYHAAIATAGVLSHTYNPRAISGARINGITTGEAGLNALVARLYQLTDAEFARVLETSPLVERTERDLAMSLFRAAD